MEWLIHGLILFFANPVNMNDPALIYILLICDALGIQISSSLICVFVSFAQLPFLKKKFLRDVDHFSLIPFLCLCLAMILGYELVC